MVHADVHDRKEAVRARKSGAFNQLQNPAEIQVNKQRGNGCAGTLSAEARPFVVFQANIEKVKYFNKERRRKSQHDSRLNKALLTIPDLLNSLVGVMLWFCNCTVFSRH